MLSSSRSSTSLAQLAIILTWPSDSRPRRLRIERVLWRSPFMIRLPSGRANEIRPPIPPRSRAPQIASEHHPFMKCDEDGIVGAKRLHQAVAARQIVALSNEGAEDAVPNDEHAAIVVVEIFGVGRVVYAMMRGRVEDIF